MPILPATIENLTRASARLRAGELVAFPTETVYGLGADARNPGAVARIFAAKGRPSTNPCIVHVADLDSARALTTDWTDTAQRLAERFWPGPLTLVLTKAADIPDIVTAGGSTVGIRIPAHPVALRLLRESGLALAAPSANRSEEVSPTCASHVRDSLAAYLPDLLILDGGECSIGIESAVVDATVDPPRLLRPGMLTAESLGAVAIGEMSGPAQSPGRMPRHYAPKKPVDLIASDAPTPPGALRLVPLALGPDAFARTLYARLRDADTDPSVARIVVESPPETPDWTAISDRLRRATFPAH